MKGIIRFFARLYPTPWRARYGAEFDQLVDDSKTNWRDVANVVTGALKMQFTKWGYGRFTVAGLAFGLALSMAAAFSIPQQWRSEAVVKVQVSSEREASDIMTRVTQEAITRFLLIKIIMSRHLYQFGGRHLPTEGVILKMREQVQITRAAKPGEFSIGFEYPDRDAAQRAVSDLMARLIDQSIIDVGPLTVRAADGTMHFRSWDATLRPVAVPSLPKKPTYPPRRAIAMFGAFGGMVAGLIFKWGVRYFAGSDHGGTIPFMRA